MTSSSPNRIWLLAVTTVAPAVAAPEASDPNLPPAPLVAPQVLGQVLETPAEPETGVGELVRRALERNPQLPIARQSEAAARLRAQAAHAVAGPTLEIVPRIVGSREAADEEIVLSQPLDVFGQRRARFRVAQLELRRAQAEGAGAERALIAAVKNAAAGLFVAQEAESLGLAQVEVARLFHDAAARRAQLGDVPPVQVQRAELELLRVQNEASNARSERLIRRAALNQLIGQPPATPLRVALPLAIGLVDLARVRPGAPQPVVQSVVAPPTNTAPPATAPATAPQAIVSGGAVPAAEGAAAEGAAGTAPVANALPANVAATGGVPGSSVIDSSGVGSSAHNGSDLMSRDLALWREQVLPGALLTRPDVVGAQATVEARRAQAQVLRRERLPQIELQARRGSVLGGASSTALRAVVTMPLFDFGSSKRERRALESEALAGEAQLALLRSQAAAQVEQALILLQQERETVDRYRTGIVPLTLDLLRKTQIGYAAGASTYLEVLEASRTLRQVQTEYLQALAGARRGEAQLEEALGAPASAAILNALANPSGPQTPPGVAAPGTVPEGVIAPTAVPPAGAIRAAPSAEPSTEARQP